MISYALFMLFILMQANLAEESITPFWNVSEESSLVVVSLLYFVLLVFIAIETHLFRKRQKWLNLLIQAEILLFFTVSYFLLAVQRSFMSIPLIGGTLTLTVLITLLLTYGALFMFHRLKSRSAKEAFNTIQLTLPFIVPFLLYSFLSDIIEIHAIKSSFQSFSPQTQMWLQYGFGSVFLLLLFLSFPYFMQKLWGCTSLHSPELMVKLNELCVKAHFKHGGIKLLGVMQRVPTAAIIGVIAPFRYVLFTKRLLDHLSDEEIEAVLAHEIGHSYHKHLVIYPILFMSGALFMGLVFDAVLPPLSETMETLVIYVLSLVYFILFIRFIFGYFSRIFEREADLFPLELGLSVESMISALDKIANLSGGIHREPNWHHYSINERIDFLRHADTKIINKHHRKVKWSVAILIVILISELIATFFL